MLKPRGELPSGETVRVWVVQQVLGSEVEAGILVLPTGSNWKQPSPRLLGLGERGRVLAPVLASPVGSLSFVHLILSRTNPSIVGSLIRCLLNVLWQQPRGLQVLGTLTSKSTHGSWKSQLLILIIRRRAPVATAPSKAMMKVCSEKAERDVFAVATMRRVTNNEVQGHPPHPHPSSD